MAAVRIIALADVVMSLDNIIAVAAAARDNMLLIVFGLLLSVPLIVFGAGLVMRVLDRHAWLVWAGAALLGYVAGDMIVADPLIAPQLTAWVGSVAGSIAPWLKPSLIHPLAGAVGIAIVLGLAALFHWRRAGHDTPSQQKA
jgi:predicted tellurium resistance membrane protein TerC